MFIAVWHTELWINYSVNFARAYDQNQSKYTLDKMSVIEVFSVLLLHLLPSAELTFSC